MKTDSHRPIFPRYHLLAVLLLAAVARALLLASGSVSFHADESVVALMARHIGQGARPTFFYGQAYMGSLDAWLIALGFQLLGESVLTIRIVQSLLYLLIVAAGYLVAWKLSERPIVAAVTGVTLAIPTANVALYTTATLGGYNELLLLGSLTLLLGYAVTHDHPRSWWRWGWLGLSVGLGWWTHGLIVVYALPVAALVLARTIVKPLGTERAALPHLVVALVAFVIGSAPWWVFDLQHNGAAISTFLTNRQTGEFAGIGIPYVPPAQRAFGLLLVGLPALIGLRFPWSSAYFLLPVGVLVASIYLVAIYRLLRPGHPLKPDARALILGMMGLFLVIFVASTFGADPTGRYFLPLALPVGLLLGTLVDGLWAQALTPTPSSSGGGEKDILNQNDQRLKRFYPLTRWLAVALVIIVVGYQAVGQIAAATTPPGFTTQFDLVSHLPNDDDEKLIHFLEERGLTHGYTNYWIAYRLAFLSGERLQYSAALPYKTTLSYNPADNRYPPYAAATAQAENIAYITANLPELDTRLQAAFRQQNLTYQVATIGPYTLYFAFEPQPPTPVPFS